MKRVVLAATLALALCGCKGIRVVDGTNLEIGITMPGTEMSLSFLSYTGGMKVVVSEPCTVTVTNHVVETNRYFGVVSTERDATMGARITPNVDACECDGCECSPCECVAGACRCRECRKECKCDEEP